MSARGQLPPELATGVVVVDELDDASPLDEVSVVVDVSDVEESSLDDVVLEPELVDDVAAFVAVALVVTVVAAGVVAAWVAVEAPDVDESSELDCVLAA